MRSAPRNIKVLARREVEHHTPTGRTLVILISGKSKGEINESLRTAERIRGNHRDVVHLPIDDVDHPSTYHTLIGILLIPLKLLFSIIQGSIPRNPEKDIRKARNILSELNLTDYDEIVVSCKMGLSRSPALAAYVALLLGQKETAINIVKSYRHTINIFMLHYLCPNIYEIVPVSTLAQVFITVAQLTMSISRLALGLV